MTTQTITSDLDTSADDFQRSVEDYKKQQAESAQTDNTNNGGDKRRGALNPDWDYQVLPLVHKGVPKEEIVFRIVGLPENVRKNPWDAKLAFPSEIINDAGKLGKFIWKKKTDYDGNELRTLDENWILHRLYDAVMAEEWDEEADRLDKNGKPKLKDGEIIKGAYVFKHKDKQCFNRLGDGNRLTGDQYVRKFFPSKTGIYFLNVISRMDDYCRSEQRTLSLARKVYEEGISEKLYAEIMKSVVSNHGHWNLDIVIQREIDKEGKSDYTVQDATASLVRKISPESTSLLYKVPSITGSTTESIPLSDEEKIYTTVNFDVVKRPSSYFKLKKDLAGLFQLVDSELGTDFFPNLEELVVEETANRNQNAPAPAQDDESTPF